MGGGESGEGISFVFVLDGRSEMFFFLLWNWVGMLKGIENVCVWV